jgi:hypothetical protein
MTSIEFKKTILVKQASLPVLPEQKYYLKNYRFPIFREWQKHITAI